MDNRKRLAVAVAMTVAVAGTMLAGAARGASYADAVVNYDPGTGAASALNDPAAALGEPSRITSGPYGGPVDPFSPPFLGSQIVSVGAGGSLTLQFAEPILNQTSHPFGADFIVFGNAGFVITNAFDPDTFTYLGTPATDGTLFGASSAQTRVSVSDDGLVFFTLDPARAPGVDQLFPTDGLGDFLQPVDPGLSPVDFAGATLEGIRQLYGGSAGGAAFDLGWALDAEGRGVEMPRARYVRIEVLSDKVELDGIGVVAVPEPSAGALAALAGVCVAMRRRFRRRGGAA
ncbi:MAG: hypothetical protein JXQ71_02415 [Verrucomicrobia bacterium]|nr:hypothetical protein [Verrucomicrobiota bacterium]